MSWREAEKGAEGWDASKWRFREPEREKGEGRRGVGGEWWNFSIVWSLGIHHKKS